MIRDIEYKKVFYQRNIELGLDGECYECISHSLDSHGYPQINRNKKTLRIHRILYMKHSKEKPEVVMHLCDNRKCINLNHLKGGTLKENVRDMCKKGRNKYNKELLIFYAKKNCYKKGNIPWNKNTKGLTKSNETSFKKGQKPKNTILTEIDVKWIRMWLKIGYKQKDIAYAFKVSRSAITDINNNKTWSGVM